MARSRGADDPDERGDEWDVDPVVLCDATREAAIGDGGLERGACSSPRARGAGRSTLRVARESLRARGRALGGCGRPAREHAARARGGRAIWTKRTHARLASRRARRRDIGAER